MRTGYWLASLILGGALVAGVAVPTARAQDATKEAAKEVVEAAKAAAEAVKEAVKEARAEDDAKAKDAKAAADKAAAVKDAAAKDAAPATETKKDEDPFGESSKTEKKADDKKGETKKGETKKGDDKKSGDKKADPKSKDGKTDPKAKEKEGDDEEVVTRVRPVVDPDVLKFYLVDGTVIAGKMTVREITVATEYGELKVPVTRIRSFKPGLESFPEVAKKLETLLENLGSNDFKLREAAQKELTAMGTSIRTELKRHETGDNPERIRRVKEILSKMTEAAEENEENVDETWLRGDAIETDEFAVVGKIMSQSFTVESKYGNLAIKLSDVKSCRRDAGDAGVEIRKSLAVEGQYIAQVQFKDSKIRVQKGDRIAITADGKITMSPWGSNQFSGPEGATNYGTGNVGGQNFPGGCLVGKIGNSGKVFKVGQSVTYTADRAGTIQFGVVVHSSYARRGYNFPGQYDLKIRVDGNRQ